MQSLDYLRSGAGVCALLLALGGCAAQTDDLTASCDDAVEHLRACSGDEVADTFAASCSADVAEEVLAASCTAAGKADGDCRASIRGCTPEFSDPLEGYKYGSINNDTLTSGIPYWIFRTLPDICPDRLPGPGGWESLGLTYEPGHDLPIGFSRRQVVGSDRVNMNCALCHTSTVRSAPDAPRWVYLGGTAHRLDMWRYVQFVEGCITSDWFEPDNVLPIIEWRMEVEGYEPLGFVERQMYWAFVKFGKSVIEDQTQISRHLWKGPVWGPGRADPFNVLKAFLLGYDMSREHGIGAEKIPAIWNQRERADRGLPGHYDGNIMSWDERNLAAAAALQAAYIDDELTARLRAWTDPIQSPLYPFAVDWPLAVEGHAIYLEQCASCHDMDPDIGTRLGEVIPLAEIGTDPERSLLFDGEFARRVNTKLKGYRFDSWRWTEGYLASPLDGVWLRAPYLHNGSVPSLSALLDPPERRPRTFYAGYDVYDPDAVGFVHTQAYDGDRPLFEYDTTIPGNSNAGHLYGTDLSAADKRALIEYLKLM